jgi:hypothetical protein
VRQPCSRPESATSTRFAGALHNFHARCKVTGNPDPLDHDESRGRGLRQRRKSGGGDGEPDQVADHEQAMNAGVPFRPCASPRAMTAATPGPGAATASAYTAQNVSSP